MDAKTNLKIWSEFYSTLWKLQQSGALAPVVWPVPQSQQENKQAKGRNTTPSREKSFKDAAREETLKWLKENGVPPGNEQAALVAHLDHWLVTRGHNLSPSSLKSWARHWINEFKETL